MTVLGVICARGGSKGLPRKNVLELGCKPMVAWSVEAAKRAQRLDRVILSTDDEEIAAAAAKAGGEVPFLRPPELAGDASSIYDVLLHALDNAGQAYDHVVLLQATSPLRRAEDIDGCVDLCLRSGAPAAISVVRAAKPPQWMYLLDDALRLKPAFQDQTAIDRRQEAKDYFLPNGAVYVASTGWLRENRTFVGPETRAYLMPPERSIDIDTRFDLVVARAVLDDINQGAVS